MKHLDAQRLLELGLEPELELTAAEAAHVAACSECAGELEMERQLSAQLGALPQPDVPASFAAATTMRYEQALSKRRFRRTAWGMVAALALGNLAALGIAALVVLNGPAVVHGLATAVQQLVVLGNALAVVASKLPFVPVLLTGALCATVLVLSTGLGRLALAGAEAR